MQAHKTAAKAATANPATTTGSLGVLVSLVGRELGWDVQTQLYVASLFLAAVPAVRALVYWYQNRNSG